MNAEEKRIGVLGEEEKEWEERKEERLQSGCKININKREKKEGRKGERMKDRQMVGIKG